MKTLITILSVVIISFSATAQSTPVKNDTASVQIVEASCGQCNFGLTDQEGCDLAVKINGKAIGLPELISTSMVIHILLVDFV